MSAVAVSEGCCARQSMSSQVTGFIRGAAVAAEADRLHRAMSPPNHRSGPRSIGMAGADCSPRALDRALRRTLDWILRHPQALMSSVPGGRHAKEEARSRPDPSRRLHPLLNVPPGLVA